MEIGFGIIGAGMIGRLHCEALAAAKGAYIAAVADNVPGKAESFAEEHGIGAAYDDYHKMLEDQHVQAVSICTPSGVHAEPVVAAARAGKHILCEKPLEIVKEKMDAMIGECRAAQVKLASVLQRRTSQACKLAHETIQRGALGRLVLGDATVKWYRAPEYYASSSWRGTWQGDGGGALMNQGIHTVDVLLWLMGPVSKVFARCTHVAHAIEVEDTVVVDLEFLNGALGAILATTAAYPGLPTTVSVHGFEGSVMLEDFRLAQWNVPSVPEPEMQEAPSLGGGSSDPMAGVSIAGHVALIEDLVCAIAEDRDPLIPGEEARKAVDLILAVYESNRTAKEVEMT